ncbi:MAG: hypothetical protein HFF74_13040 [Oscillospiraceae bacterium]|nr:hypothetical protein [Oscillospiraceae bacterium]
MNYTEKYHLPQWVETDRIMMKDFNSAMTSIERGLAAADVAGALADSMSRDVYRQAVAQRVHHAAGGLADALWVNTLTSLEDAGGKGHGWNGRYGVYHGEGGFPTMEGIMALGPKEEHQINTISTGTVHYKERASATFTSDGYGLLDQIKLWLHHGNKNGYTANYTITMTRLDTGETVGTSDEFTQPGTGVSPHYWVHLGFPLEPGISYRLEYTITSLNGFYGWAGLSLATTRYTETEDTLTFAVREAEPEIVKTVTPPEWAAGALAVLRWKGDGRASLSIDGQTLAPLRTREGRNAVGGVCQETELLAEQLPEGPFALKLLMEKGEGSLDVYDYGLIWR